LEFTLVICLFIIRPDEGSVIDLLIIVILATMAIIILPATLSWIIKKESAAFSDSEFREKWEALFRDLRTSEKSKRLYYLIFIIRRLLFSVIAFTFRSVPPIQLILLNLLNLGILIY